MNFSERRKGCQEIRAGRAGSDADPTKDLIFCARVQNYFVGSEAGGAETSVSRGRRERASGIRRRFDKYTLHELVIDCSRWRLLIRRGRRE
jgi:hypothetical protein